jgi:amino acid transporter/mannitol/fructose-specific phosphotransferase system IIA component (Ntr-type)
MTLKRKLGFWEVFCIAAGAMISSGLFVLPGQAFKVSGPAIVLGYALAALMVIPALLSKAELATAMPRSGGSYFFIERSMGAFPGTLAGLAAWLSLALKSAFAMIGIGAFTRLLWPGAALSEGQWEWVIKGVAVAGCLFFTLLNVLSVKLAGRVQIILVAALLAALGVFVLAGAGGVRQHPNFDHFMAAGWGNVLATAGLVFVSFGGLTKVASVAEEVRHPGRNIPGAMFLACVVVSLFYVAAVFVVVGVQDAADLARGPYGSLTPLSEAAGAFLGRFGVVLLSAAGILAFVTTGNSGILSASRSPMAMARDGLLPPVLQRVSRRFGTPYVSVLLTSGFMIAMIVLLKIGDLVKVASTMMLILFLLVNVAVLIMRGSRLQNYRPLYRCPLFPWLQVAGIAVYAALIVLLSAELASPVPLIATGAFVMGALAWYGFYARPRTDRESALVYMVRRALAREMQRGQLEEELREIALERDEVVHDRFDRLVQECEILDLPGRTDVAELFDKAADLLAKRLDVGKAALLEKFQAREQQSTTVIQPGLAIPHVVVDGRGLFAILLVRCREGIAFAGEQQPVHTAFILVGSQDERNYHLRALMAIAHIVQEKDFERRWLAAPKAEHLRDILLLSDRERSSDT